MTDTHGIGTDRKPIMIQDRGDLVWLLPNLWQFLLLLCRFLHFRPSFGGAANESLPCHPAFRLCERLQGEPILADPFRTPLLLYINVRHCYFIINISVYVSFVVVKPKRLQSSVINQWTTVTNALYLTESKLISYIGDPSKVPVPLRV